MVAEKENSSPVQMRETMPLPVTAEALLRKDLAPQVRQLLRIRKMPVNPTPSQKR